MTRARERDEERWSLDREVEALQRILEERGEMGHRELRAAVGGGRWGPGLFTQAVREAMRRRAISSRGRRRYGPGV